MKIAIQDNEKYPSIFTDNAIDFIAHLVEHFAPRVQELLKTRAARQQLFDAGATPHFREMTSDVRRKEWFAAPIPADLLDRRVEITGPTDRKMIINALNSGANVFMADLEDSNSPTWENIVQGQVNLMDAVRKTITFQSGDKQYKLNDKTAVLMVRPRGWHMVEKHFVIDEKPIPAALMDFGLYFFHNIKELREQGTSTYFYLPKMECAHEAKLWDDIFRYAQNKFNLPTGTIKATVLVETLPLAFEMDEVIYELQSHICGMNAGRWDYIFSFIKKFAKHPNKILPDRSQLTMDKAFLNAYCKLLVKTCHKRGIHAMGGMSALIPIKGDELANKAAMDKVVADKEREARGGADGAWISHPGMVKIVKKVFDEIMLGANQIHYQPTYDVGEKDLLEIHKGTRTMEGLRNSVRVGVQYLEAWLRGVGAVAIYNLMEDVAVFEINRSLVWQWLHHSCAVDDVMLTSNLLLEVIEGEMERIANEVGDRYKTGKFQEAKELFTKLVLAPKFEEFLTTVAYDQLP